MGDMLDKSLFDLVNTYVTFPSGMSLDGWSRCYCEVCGDGRRQKGPRGGWKFEGDFVTYHCFNCGIKGNFSPDREFPFSKDMRKILDSFDIPKKEYLAVAYANKIDSDKRDGEGYKVPEKKFFPLKFFDIPKHFYLLEDADLDNAIANSAKKKLLKDYSLSVDSYPFYLSTGVAGVGENKAQVKGLLNRIIIPYFKNNRMIYYQARAIEDDIKPKYYNMDIPKTNIIFNMDALYQHMDRPLYVFESAFDAIHVNGVAVMENNITSNQIEILNKSPRRKVVVPDRGGDSNKLVEIGLEQGWGLALPELGTGNKDLCEGINKFGKLFIINSLVNKTYFDREARLMSRIV